MWVEIIPPPICYCIVKIFRLAYRALHEASTVLLPSSCPLCRRNEEGHEKEAMGAGAAEEEAKPHCDICQLSAIIVMRGVGLLEREKDYDNAIHYLDILLRVKRSGFHIRCMVWFSCFPSC